MHKGKTFLAIIPARGGSKGIPNKNIFKVKGRYLIDYTIKEALDSKYIDRVIVSTDSEQIAEISLKCGAEIPFLRPSELAQDNSKTIDVIIHVINKLSDLGQLYDYIVLLQPTQPLRKAFHIDGAIEKIIKYSMNSLVSVTKVKEHPILMRTVDSNGKLGKLLDINSTMRRQDFPDYFKVNGAIYINKVDENLNHNTSLNDNELAYIMDRKYDLDIDDYFDLKLFKWELDLL